MLCDILDELGFEISRTPGSLGAALRIAEEEQFDLALLDINIRGELVYPLAQMLAKRKVPFVFVTGYDRAELPYDYQDHPFLAKPYSFEQLKTAVAEAAPSLTGPAVISA